MRMWVVGACRFLSISTASGAIPPRCCSSLIEYTSDTFAHYNRRCNSLSSSSSSVKPLERSGVARRTTY